jgi:hypothetical protein
LIISIVEPNKICIFVMSMTRQDETHKVSGGRLRPTLYFFIEKKMTKKREPFLTLTSTHKGNHSLYGLTN